MGCLLLNSGFLIPYTVPTKFIKIPAKHKRSSLADAFVGLDIGSSNNQSPFMDDPHLGRSIRRKLASSLDSGSVRVKSLHGIEQSFTIAMDGAYDYNVLGDIDPDDLHEELQAYTAELSKMVQSLSPGETSKLDDHFVDTLSRMVFSSNMIENAGSGLDVTLKICQAIFRGEEVPDEITNRDSDYECLKKELIRKNLPHGTECILRSRREIVQHAKATSYIMNQICLRGCDLSEEIILETHRILTYKVDTEQGMSWTQYSGVYRQWPVCTGLHSFMDYPQVPGAMRAMIASIKKDLEIAVECGEIDPIALSAKYCHQFVNIHPFLDGNGRTCRLILNALLLKYGNVLVCIGEQGDDRSEYMGIASAASYNEGSQQEDLDDIDEDMKPKYHKGLASLTLRHARDSMRRAVNLLKRKS